MGAKEGMRKIDDRKIDDRKMKCACFDVGTCLWSAYSFLSPIHAPRLRQDFHGVVAPAIMWHPVIAQRKRLSNGRCDHD